MNFQLTGRTADIDGQIDSKVTTDNDQQVKFKEALKTFIDSTKGIYGNVSQVSIYGNGQVDHGGMALSMNITITNYQDNNLDANGQPIQQESQPADSTSTETTAP